MKTKRVQGFNKKEQAIYNLLAKDPTTPRSFAEMKALFEDDAVEQLKKYEGGLYKDKKQIDAMMQSMGRNSVRRLIRDGWAEQCARGTYRLTRAGKDRLKKGVDKTASFGSKKGRPKLTEDEKAKSAKKKAAKKRKAAKAKAAKAAQPKKKAASQRKAAKAKPAAKAAAKPKKKAASKAKPKKAAAKKSTRKAAKAKGNGVNKDKMKAIKARAAKEAGKEKAQVAAQAAKKRAAQAVKDEATAPMH